MSMLFQSGALFTDMSVFDNIAFPIREHTQLSEDLFFQLQELVVFPGSDCLDLPVADVLVPSVQRLTLTVLVPGDQFFRRKSDIGDGPVGSPGFRVEVFGELQFQCVHFGSRVGFLTLSQGKSIARRHDNT